MTTGRLRHWDKAKQAGYVRADKHRDFRVAIRDVPSPHTGVLCRGETLEFEEAVDAEGQRVARNVRRIRVFGTLTRFDWNSGFGWISPDCGEEDFFVHFRDVCDSDNDATVVGRRVEFTPCHGPKGPLAAAVCRAQEDDAADVRMADLSEEATAHIEELLQFWQEETTRWRDSRGSEDACETYEEQWSEADQDCWLPRCERLATLLLGWLTTGNPWPTVTRAHCIKALMRTTEVPIDEPLPEATVPEFLKQFLGCLLPLLTRFVLPIRIKAGVWTKLGYSLSINDDLLPEVPARPAVDPVLPSPNQVFIPVAETAGIGIQSITATWDVERDLGGRVHARAEADCLLKFEALISQDVTEDFSQPVLNVIRQVLSNVTTSCGQMYCPHQKALLPCYACRGGRKGDFTPITDGTFARSERTTELQTTIYVPGGIPFSTPLDLWEQDYRPYDSFMFVLSEVIFARRTSGPPKSMRESRIRKLRNALFNLAESTGSGSELDALKQYWTVFDDLRPHITLPDEAQERLERLRKKRDGEVHPQNRTAQFWDAGTAWLLARIAVHYRIRELMSGDGQAEGPPQDGNLEMFNKGVEAILVNAGVAGLDCLKEGSSAAY